MIEELKIIISAEVTKAKKAVDDAKKQIKSFKDQVKQASADVDKNFEKIGSGMAAGAKAAGTALVGVTAALLALGASTQEYRNEQAKLITAFEAAGGSATEAKETYNDLYRVLGDSGQAVEAANHIAKLTTEEKALSEWTNICQGVYATFGDSLPIEGLTEAANETAKVGQVTGSLADALNWASLEGETFGVAVKENIDFTKLSEKELKKLTDAEREEYETKKAQWEATNAYNKSVLDAASAEDFFNIALANCNSEAEREQLIRETLNGVYSDAAAKYEENNKAVLDQNEAQAKLQENLAKLGEAVAPVITAFTNFAGEALAAVVPYIQQLAETYMPKLSEVLGTVAESLGTAMGFVADNWQILAAIGGVIGGIAAAIGLYNVVAAVKAAMDAAQVTTLWALVSAYAAQAAAMVVALAPYLAIVAAVAAVIAIIVLCIKHWDKIKETVKKVWNSIKEWTVNAVNSVVSKFEELKSKAVEKVQNLKDSAVNKFNEIKSGIVNTCSNIVSSVKEKFNAIVNGIKEKMNSAKSTVKSIIDAIKGFFGFKITWPKIPMPHFGISPSGWKIGDLLKGSIPKLSIDWYANGGVFEKPTLFMGNGRLSGLGENGAEAVVPLENNLAWLDKLADMLNERMGGNKPIVLQVDGKTFAQTAISTINMQTRQTGRLALNLV